MTCYLRMHEIAVAVRRPLGPTDWDDTLRRWREARGVEGRDAALASMPVAAVDFDDLPDTDLGPFAGLILSGRSDQRLLAGMSAGIEAILEEGGVVVFSGQLAGEWLPGTTPFERTGASSAPGPDPLGAGPPQLASPALFDGVDPADVPSLLYRDGWHRPPSGAQVVARRADGTPGAYIDRNSTAGTILVHCGPNLLANGTSASSAARIVPRLVSWVAHAAAGSLSA
ncbi:MAG: hypothetical protein ACRDY7_04610 [Acidimicrobiia bacterium]